MCIYIYILYRYAYAVLSLFFMYTIKVNLVSTMRCHFIIMSEFFLFSLNFILYSTVLKFFCPVEHWRTEQRYFLDSYYLSYSPTQLILHFKMMSAHYIFIVFSLRPTRCNTAYFRSAERTLCCRL